MGQRARAVRRQAVLFLRGHFAKGQRVAIGQELRIVAKALLAARRHDDAGTRARACILNDNSFNLDWIMMSE